MTTKFDIFIKENVNSIEEEIKHFMKSRFDIDVNVIDTQSRPVQYIIEFPEIITSREPWFFKILQILKMYSYRAHIVKNKIQLIKIKKYDDN